MYSIEMTMAPDEVPTASNFSASLYAPLYSVVFVFTLQTSA